MKKGITIGLIVVIALLIAPWGIGQLAAKRINNGLDKAVAEAPFLTIVERKYKGGWFSSDLDVTFALFEGVSSSDSNARFTVHNDIKHGPILGSGLGLALVKSNLVFEEKTRLEVEKVFGKEGPIDITTKIGFTGGSKTVVSSPARNFEQDGDKVAWDALNIVIETTGGGDSYTLDGSWPKIEVQAKDGTDVAFSGFRAKAAGKRIVGNLFDTDLDFAVAEMRVKDENEDVSLKDLQYIAVTELKDNLVDMSVKLGCGAVTSQKLNFTEAHYDLTVRRLHPESLDKVMTEWKNLVYDDEKAVAAVAGEGLSPTLKQNVLELLKHEPEFAIDRISFATEEGAGTIKGVIKLKGVTKEDFDAGAIAFLPKIFADLDIDLSEAMLLKLSGSPEASNGMVQQGFAELKDGRLLSKIQFEGGKLMINGKEQALPGMGGPPAAAPAMQE